MEMGYAPGWFLGSTMLWKNKLLLTPPSPISAANASIADCTPLVVGATKVPAWFEIRATGTRSLAAVGDEM
jgi:hypothetical protein